MELNEKQFIIGFNSGYLLAKYEPEILTNLLAKINPINSYIFGMNSGKKEYELEHRSKKLDELKDLRNKVKGNREIDLN
jgi:hypothetical protein